MRTPAVQREEDKTTAPIGTLQLRGAVAASSWAWGKSQPIFLVGNLMKGLHRKGRGTKSAVVRKMKKGTEKHSTGVHCYCVALLPCCEWGPYSTTSCTNATQKKNIYIFLLEIINISAEAWSSHHCFKTIQKQSEQTATVHAVQSTELIYLAQLITCSLWLFGCNILHGPLWTLNKSKNE